MLIFAQSQEVFRPNATNQPQPLRPEALPFTGDALSLVVVIADAEVFLKVFPRVCEVVLRLGRDHAQNDKQYLSTDCVSHAALTVWPDCVATLWEIGAA